MHSVTLISLFAGVQVEVYRCSDIYSSTRPISDMYTCSRSEAFRCPRSRLSSEDECELPSIYQKHRYSYFYIHDNNFYLSVRKEAVIAYEINSVPLLL